MTDKNGKTLNSKMYLRQCEAEAKKLLDVARVNGLDVSGSKDYTWYIDSIAFDLMLNENIPAENKKEILDTYRAFCYYKGVADAINYI